MSMGANISRADFDALYNLVPCGLLVFKIDGSIVHCNETLLDWMLVQKEELVNSRFPNLLDNGGRLYYQLFVQPLLRMHKVVKEISFQIETPRASFSCLFSAAVAAVNDNDEMLVHAAVFKVVDRKKYENELLTKKAKADEEKQRSSEALRIIAFAQSHLVRAPLANILGLVDLINQMDMDEEMKHLNTMLQKSARNLDAQIKNIVNAASTEKNNQT